MTSLLWVVIPATWPIWYYLQSSHGHFKNLGYIFSLSVFLQNGMTASVYRFSFHGIFFRYNMSLSWQTFSVSFSFVWENLFLYFCLLLSSAADFCFFLTFLQFLSRSKFFNISISLCISVYGNCFKRLDGVYFPRFCDQLVGSSSLSGNSAFLFLYLQSFLL